MSVEGFIRACTMNPEGDPAHARFYHLMHQYSPLLWTWMYPLMHTYNTYLQRERERERERGDFLLPHVMGLNLQSVHGGASTSSPLDPEPPKP